jgi:hypothetical protein
MSVPGGRSYPIFDPRAALLNNAAQGVNQGLQQLNSYYNDAFLENHLVPVRPANQISPIHGGTRPVKHFPQRSVSHLSSAYDTGYARHFIK